MEIRTFASLKFKNTMTNTAKRAMLIILDGWGMGKNDKSNAIHTANTPYFDSLITDYPNSKLKAAGEAVGLPEGQMGNSEVGHLNLGAGRRIYHDLLRINKAIAENTIRDNEQLIKAFSYAKENDKAVHFVGLVSDGGVHSLDSHLYELCKITGDYNLNKVFIHAITDGRDCDPKSGLGFVENLQNAIADTPAEIATLVGRYYSMDRDKRWERVKVGYDLMVKGEGEKVNELLPAIERSYADGVTDEFIKPILLKEEGLIQEGDVVLCFNFRTDRLRQMTTVLTQENFEEFGMHTLDLQYYTMTNYDKKFKEVNVVYDTEDVNNTIGEVLAKGGKHQLRIAETEKYAHVTFFFSGGREEEFENEERRLISSPKVATYDLQPEMSAPEVKDAVVEEIKRQKHDFICLNYANGDMVGHTGIYDAILKAAETVDNCIKETIQTAIANDYTIILTADHGNADYAVNNDGSPNTAHSLNEVPCILINSDHTEIKDGILADLAPTLLTLLGMEIPEEMKGISLV